MSDSMPLRKVIAPAPVALSPRATSTATVSTSRERVAPVREEQAALVALRENHQIFVRNTGCYGNGSLAPLNRLHNNDNTFIKIAGSLAATSLAAGFITALFPELHSWTLSCVAGLATTVGGIFATVVGANFERSIFKQRILKREKVQHLRDAYDSTTSNLQRVMLGRLAQASITSLDKRYVRGDGPRVLLQSIVDDAATIDTSTRTYADVALRCFDLCFVEGHDRLKKSLDASAVADLENSLASLEQPQRIQLRDTLKSLLFDGELPCLEFDSYPTEVRMLRVLSGVDDQP